MRDARPDIETTRDLLFYKRATRDLSSRGTLSVPEG